jgi:hypothetical protein
MARIPAYCTNGHAFDSPIFELGEGHNFGLYDMETKCPICGAPAKFVEGQFDVSDGKLKVRSGPLITHLIVNEINRILDEAKAKSSNSTELIAEIERVSPEIAVVLKPLIKYKTPAFIIAVVYIMLNALHINLNLNAKIDLNELLAQAITKVENSPSEPSIVQANVTVTQSMTQSQTVREPSRHRLHQPQLRPKKKQRKIGPRWRRKRIHPFCKV